MSAATARSSWPRRRPLGARWMVWIAGLHERVGPTGKIEVVPDVIRRAVGGHFIDFVAGGDELVQRREDSKSQLAPHGGLAHEEHREV